MEKPFEGFFYLLRGVSLGGSRVGFEDLVSSFRILEKDPQGVLSSVEGSYPRSRSEKKAPLPRGIFFLRGGDCVQALLTRGVGGPTRRQNSYV
jgi:hypothetical protein